MNNKLKIGVFFGALGVMLTAGHAFDADAHGYISKPESRAYLANKGINVSVGAVQFEPQSIEGPKGFPSASGPADGKIAGAGKYAAMDVQTDTRWQKVPLNSGPNVVEWTLTAPHQTASWDYYITKKGWDPNKPLASSDFELLKHINGANLTPEKVVKQQIDIPSDREGYYVILGVWNIADTTNAFYQVIDANISNGSTGTPEVDTKSPSEVTGLKMADRTSNSITLNWKEATDNQGVSKYTVYRNGVKVGETSTTSFKDVSLQADKSYNYSVVAQDFAGNKSKMSASFAASTLKETTTDYVAPEAPSNLHSMGKTNSSVSLMWGAVNHSLPVKYEVYRDGKKIITTSNTSFEDKGLAKGDYSYTVSAVDSAGNKSSASNLLRVAIAGGEQVLPPVPVIEEKGTWSADKIYVENDTVNYNGKTYRAKWWTKGNNPETNSVWQVVDNGVQVWNAQKAFTSGDKVLYNGKIYQAKWWVQGQAPSLNGAWTLVTK